MIAVSTAAAGVMIGLVNVSAAERVDHYPHPRSVVECYDKEPRVLPKTNHGSPAKNMEATNGSY
jgi:hypothetical protein